MKNLPIRRIQDVNVLQSNKFRRELESLRSLLQKPENEHLIPVEEDFFRQFIKNQENMIINEYMKQPYQSTEAIFFFQKFMRKEFSFVEKEKSHRLNAFSSLSTIMEGFFSFIDSLEFEKFRFNKSIYVEFISTDTASFKSFLRKTGIDDTSVFSLFQHFQKNKQQIKYFLSEED